MTKKKLSKDSVKQRKTGVGSTSEIGETSVFEIEYAKSARSACGVCREKIQKNKIRTKQVTFETALGMAFGGEKIYHHVECFVRQRSKLGWSGDKLDKLPGFQNLCADDKKTIKTLIPDHQGQAAETTETIETTKKSKKSET